MVELWPYIDERSNQFFDPSNNVAVATLFVNIFVTLSTDFFCHAISPIGACSIRLLLCKTKATICLYVICRMNDPNCRKYVLSVFTARCYASAVLAMGLCLCLSVCHKSELPPTKSPTSYHRFGQDLSYK